MQTLICPVQDDAHRPRQPELDGHPQVGSLDIELFTTVGVPSVGVQGGRLAPPPPANRFVEREEGEASLPGTPDDRREHLRGHGAENFRMPIDVHRTASADVLVENPQVVVGDVGGFRWWSPLLCRPTHGPFGRVGVDRELQ
ncbi:MAG: hypothetical protein WD830_07280, partial [Chloroflexota bacterium]